MEYDLELDRAAETIKKQKAKIVCIQLPDGLKKYAKYVQQELEKNTGAQIVIWLGSCFGACDIPFHIKKLGIDLLIQWGHSAWKY